MVNRVVLVGNLGRDPEIRDFENGSKLARFSIATGESYKDKSGEWQNRTEWHEIVAWRFLADRAQNQLAKGATIYLEGKLRTRKWQDQNGNDRKTTEIEASSFRVISKVVPSESLTEGPPPSVEDAPPIDNPPF